MPYAVTLRLDSRGKREVERLWRLIDASGVAPSIANIGYAPHVTLSRHETLDPLAVSDLLDGFAAGMPPIDVRIDRLACFTEPTHVLWLGIEPTDSLAAFHAALRQLLPNAQWHPHTEAGRWVPHVTLVTAIPSATVLTKLEAAVSDLFQPFAARLDRLDLVRFPPLEVLNSLRLAGAHAVRGRH
jgi:2'-5' RNA ligase